MTKRVITAGAFATLVIDGTVQSARPGLTLPVPRLFFLSLPRQRDHSCQIANKCYDLDHIFIGSEYSVQSLLLVVENQATIP